MTVLDLIAPVALRWKRYGACVGVDPKLFFPENGENTKYARGVCAACPVRKQCLQYAVENGEKFGIWGGKTERERRAYNNDEHLSEIEHGTNIGYQKHRRRGTSCDECNAAHTIYRREASAASLR